MSPNLRVRGHTLVGKGWGHHLDFLTGGPMANPECGGFGRALCSCGSFSPVLPSRDKRVKWMREVHKPEVLEGEAIVPNCRHYYQTVGERDVGSGNVELIERCAHCGDEKKSVVPRLV